MNESNHTRCQTSVAKNIGIPCITPPPSTMCICTHWICTNSEKGTSSSLGGIASWFGREHRSVASFSELILRCLPDSVGKKSCVGEGSYSHAANALLHTHKRESTHLLPADEVLESQHLPLAPTENLPLPCTTIRTVITAAPALLTSSGRCDTCLHSVLLHKTRLKRTCNNHSL